MRAGSGTHEAMLTSIIQCIQTSMIECIQTGTALAIAGDVPSHGTTPCVQLSLSFTLSLCFSLSPVALVPHTRTMLFL